LNWLLLIYKLPAEPTRLRATIWRKLKTAGAVYLQNGVAALPFEPATESLMRELASEIEGMQGSAYLLIGAPLSDASALLSIFNAARITEYAEIVGRCQEFHAELAKERAVGNFTFAELEENEDDLAKLVAWFTKVQARDRFAVAAHADAEAALAACHADLAVFESEVHNAEHVS